MTEPSPTEMTAGELDQAIVDAYRTYIAVARAYPRDQARIDAAFKALNDLKALRAGL